MLNTTKVNSFAETCCKLPIIDSGWWATAIHFLITITKIIENEHQKVLSSAWATYLWLVASII